MSASPVIKCPHCGHEVPESSNAYKWRDSFITDCLKCNKLFYVKVVRAYEISEDWRSDISSKKYMT